MEAKVRAMDRLIGQWAIDKESIKNGYCPICNNGKKYRVVAVHVFRKHGIDSRELRIRAGFYAGESICDPEHSQKMREVRDSREEGSNGHKLVPGSKDGERPALRAYQSACRRLIVAHRKEFEALLREERAKYMR